MLNICEKSWSTDIGKEITNFILEKNINHFDFIELRHIVRRRNGGKNIPYKNRKLLAGTIAEEVTNIKKIPVLINNRSERRYKHFLSRGHLHDHVYPEL